ncbi:enoyl-CoA hydratase/isomerase [Sulfuritalea hydrogenivorans sk43H]|uniref:Enoyl-CoA hydratase/isomerase n=2 Tax=Sulfuritalea hydrogenivorans TaxID=748811 RepID=W0SH53_9PROT|nr:enoyl-CoA hydratase/isomerase [Sulfuritalea hydrogenivorans sk43H]
MNMAVAYRALSIRQDGGVLHLTLNRPEVRNAMSLAMVDELLAALNAAEADGVTRVIVLRGAGGHFCAGADLKDMAAARASEDSDPVAHTNTRFGWLCAEFARTPLAVVAVVEGTVMGGGFGLACAADVTLAHASASFRLPETSLGLVPAQIAPYLVERLGFAEAKRLAVTGGKLDARTALTLRLVHAVADDEAALSGALANVLNDILACAPGAVAATKRLIAKARLAAPESLIDEAAAAFSLAAQGSEGIEGTTAFLQKRKPSWAP